MCNLKSCCLVCFECSLSGPSCLHVCSPLFFLSLHSSTVGSWLTLEHVSYQITVRADRPLASYSQACFKCEWDHDIIGQNAWFPHWNCPPFQCTFASSHCIDSSCSESIFEWNSGFPVFLFRLMVTICLDNNQSNKSHRMWIIFLRYFINILWSGEIEQVLKVHHSGLHHAVCTSLAWAWINKGLQHRIQFLLISKPVVVIFQGRGLLD